MAGMLINIKISDHARSSLAAHHLDLTSGEPSESEFNFLRQNRPPFVAPLNARIPYSSCTFGTTVHYCSRLVPVGSLSDP